LTDLDVVRGLTGSGSPLPDVPLTTSCCPECGIQLELDRLRGQAYVCECGHHLPMHADAWIAHLADAGSWDEHWGSLRPFDVLTWEEPKPYQQFLEQAQDEGLNEAVRTGTCRLGGVPIWLAVFDFRFFGGTLSVVAGERLARAVEAAAADRFPFVLVTASGGARMQEGPLALMQMAKVNAAVARLHSSSVAFFSILTNPTYGGTAASLALVADANIGEPGAAIGFTGPRVIKQATQDVLPAGFQSAEFQLEHGQLDMIVARNDLRALLHELADLYQ
jgi:acetyl-CoA carboxylase carboxyl transferase beta subunit